MFYLDAEIFFGFSNSEFINDNTFSQKDKKTKRYIYRDFKVYRSALCIVFLFIKTENTKFINEIKHVLRAFITW